MEVEGKRWAISFMFGTKHGLQRPPYVDGVFALDDPKPALVQVYRLTAQAVRGERNGSPQVTPDPTPPLETR